MLSRNLRLLLRISTTSAINGSLTQKGMSVISAPPARRITLFTRFLHLGILGVSFLTGPVLFFTNLKKIRGIKDPVDDEQNEDSLSEAPEEE
ncbi:hypothetical protein QE152_g5327 [Popillia japonica]|uniref:Essential MCU regulator, mitochondrial n=1 Tax=Popillia japonica TaxID=7064 RepID=A0AAW1MMW0_POPJA